MSNSQRDNLQTMSGQIKRQMQILDEIEIRLRTMKELALVVQNYHLDTLQIQALQQQIEELKTEIDSLSALYQRWFSHLETGADPEEPVSLNRSEGYPNKQSQDVEEFFASIMENKVRH